MAAVKLFGTLRKYADGTPLGIPGETVRAVLAALCEDNPPLGEALLENGDLRSYFLITLNGHDIKLTAGMDTAVSEGDQLSIFSPIAGG